MSNLSDSEAAAISAAASLFEVESESSRHYERMRSNITQYNVAICAAFVGISDELAVPVSLSVPFLMLQAAVEQERRRVAPAEVGCCLVGVCRAGD
jgi:hypothetical protein